MKWYESRVLWGVVLIALGGVLLLQAFGLLDWLMTLFWVLAFGVAGAAFLIVFLSDQSRWWAVIPGFTLLGLAALIGLDWLWPAAGEALGGTVFLGGIGLSFWAVYFLRREQWWAVIPGGVLFTLALVAALPDDLEGTAGAGVLFLGIGLTFALLSFVSAAQGRMTWARIPAAILGAMGVLFILAATPLGNLWPVALILFGLYLLYRMVVSR
jgi:hypothetical protein